MSYLLLRSTRAARRLRRLSRTDRTVHALVLDAIEALTETPRPSGCTRLVNRSEWRVRVGDYRILYLINDTNQTIRITDIAHRRDVYR